MKIAFAHCSNRYTLLLLPLHLTMSEMCKEKSIVAVLVIKLNGCWYQAHPAMWKIGFASFVNTAMNHFAEYESDTVVCAITLIQPRLCSVRRVSWIDRHDDSVHSVGVTPTASLWQPAFSVIKSVHAKFLTQRCCVQIVRLVMMCDGRFVRIVFHLCQRCEHPFC